MNKLKNKFLISSTSALAGMAIGYMIKSTMNNGNGQNDEDNQYYLDQFLENAGKPDEIDSIERDQLENAKMVSEGSQFGVQYYNELRESNAYDESETPNIE